MQMQSKNTTYKKIMTVNTRSKISDTQTLIFEDR